MSTRCLPGTTAAFPLTRTCRSPPGIALAWSDCCDIALGHPMSGLLNITADGSRRSDVFYWQSPLARCHQADCPLLRLNGRPRRRVHDHVGKEKSGRDEPPLSVECSDNHTPFRKSGYVRNGSKAPCGAMVPALSALECVQHIMRT